MQIYVDAKELLAAARFCENKKNKGTREILRCVHVESNENDYALVSTDSYKLIKFVHNKISGFENDDVFTCNISIDIIKDAVKSSDELVCVKYDEVTQAITLDIYKRKFVNRATVNATANDGRYPMYNKLLEKNVALDEDGNELPNVSAVSLNASYIEEMCKDIQLAYGKETAIDIEFGSDANHSPVLFSAIKEMGYDDEGRLCNPVIYCNGLLMPVRKY